MLNAKIKAATVLLCGLTALGLSASALLYQARAGADDSPQDARAREKTLLEEVEKAREEAARQRDKAEAERRRAEEALLALKEQLAKAQDAAEKVRYAGNIRQAQQEFSTKQEAEKILERLAADRAATRERFLKERQELMERMRKLEASERETLAKMKTEEDELLKRLSVGRVAPAGDKLDRILERLDRIEQRLERLERANKK